MPETRPLKTEPEAIGDLDAKVAELEAKLVARTARQPTGTMQMTLAQTAPAKTLLLDGSTVSRTEYAALWKWVNDHNAAGFGDGDGTTTFTLPDMRDRVPAGAGGQYTPGQTFGVDRVTLTEDQMPPHDHGAAPNHEHYFQSSSTGSHGGHAPLDNSANDALVPQGSYWRVPTTSAAGRGVGSHWHDGYTANSGGHTHDPAGAGAEIDARPPSIAVNYLIWT